MDSLLKLNNIDNEPNDLLSSDEQTIAAKMQFAKEEKTSVDIKREKPEDNTVLPVITRTFNETCTNYSMRVVTDEPRVKIKSEDLQDEIMDGPLVVSTKTKDESEKGIKKGTKDKQSASPETGLLYKNNRSLIRNNQIKDNKKHICDICHKIFKMKGDLIRHLRTHTGEKPFECNVCEKSFSLKITLERHMLVHSSERNTYFCEVCGKFFSYKSTLKKHKRIKHNNGDHIQMHTGVAGEGIEEHHPSEFQTEEKNKQIDLNNSKHKCHICQQVCRWESALIRHLRIHTGEKPFLCEICMKSFNIKHNLDTHMLLHSGEKPYECDTCKRAFTQKSTLTKHKLIHTRLKPFACSLCDKSFLKLEELSEHKLIHTRELPYYCDLCNVKFRHKSHLTEHGRVHTGEKPYTCNICDKSFAQISTLNTHKKTHDL